MEYFISTFWVALEYIYCYLFWNAFLPQKCTGKKCFAIFAVAWIISLFYTNIGLNQTLKICISLGLFVAMSTLLYKVSWFRRIFVIIFGYVVSGMIDTVFVYGISSFLGLSLEAFAWRQMFYVATVTVGKLFSIFIAWMLYRYQLFLDFQSIEKKWLLLTVLFPLVSFAMLIAVFDGFRERSDLSLTAFVFSGILVVANIAIIYLIRMMEKSTKNAQETALMNQQMEIQTDSIIALEKSYRDQRKATHDFRNQLQTIHDLLANGNSDAAFAYVQQLQGMQTTRVFTVNSHHPIVDAILNHKYQSAQEQGIDIQVQVNDLSSITLGTDILVVLLTNLLDNAIEACVRLNSNRVIQFRMIATESIYISIRNTSLPVTIKEDHIQTTKEPKKDHGYGLPCIQRLLNQLNAEFAFTYKDGWFEFAAEIPYL